MPRVFPEYTRRFFWTFKKMDNANYNFEILQVLYKARDQNSGDSHFNKPITLLLVAMIECMLEDFMVRINTHQQEVIPNLPQRVVLYIKGKQIDQLEHLIAQAQKHNLLQAPLGDPIYDNLDFLRKVRNRVHIQTMGDGLAPHEALLFTDRTRQSAESIFERTCEILCNIHPRWDNPPLPMTDFPRPWL